MRLKASNCNLALQQKEALARLSLASFFRERLSRAVLFVHRF
jgi:hypothetical protein